MQKKETNPFILTFGKEPVEYISRMSINDEILQIFQQDNPNYQAVILTGVRGSGKTVLLNSIIETLENDSANWICIRLNSSRDYLHSLAAKLYAVNTLQKELKIHFNASILGFGVSVEKDNRTEVSDIETITEHLLKIAAQKGKRVCIAIDEISNSEDLRIFAKSFQMFAGEKLPVFLLMTGLYENIYEIEKDKTITFIRRAMKVTLEPLNLQTISASYKRIFNIDKQTSVKLAKLTKGYAFAYQALGYIFWQKRKIDDDFMDEYDRYLSEYVYDMMWKDLSEKDRTILSAVSECTEIASVKEIREQCHMDSKPFSFYRDRLIKKGLLSSPKQGYLTFSLPRFREFIKEWELFESL